VRIPPQSALLKHTHRYGWEREPESRLLKISDVAGRKAQLAKQHEALVTKLRAFDGAIHEVGRMKDTPAVYGLEPTDALLTKLAERAKWLTDTRFETVMELATLDGAMQETEFVRQVMELRSRGADIQMPKI
jgi:predicted nucleic acid-binding protein